MQKKYNRWILSYTVLFGICVLVLEIVFRMRGVTFVYGYDGVEQCLPLFDFQKKAFTSLLSGKGFPMIDWYAGMGSDSFAMFGSLDLFNPICILFALLTSSAQTAYTCMLFTEMYLGGLFFGMLARKYLTDAADPGLFIVLGALMYTLNGYNTYYGTAHIWFLDGPMYLALMLLCIEKTIREKKVLPLIVTTLLCVISDYYIAYIVLMLSAIFTLIRLTFMLRSGIAETVRTGLRVLVSVLLGILLSAAVLLPIAYAYTHNARLGIDTASSTQPFYAWTYYKSMIAGWSVPGIAANHSVPLGYLPITPVALFWLFGNRKSLRGPVETFLRVCAVTVLLMLSVRYVGSWMNAGGYVTGRWTFVLGLLNCAVTVRMLREMRNAEKKQIRPVLILLCVYMLLTAALMLTEHGDTRMYALLTLIACIPFIPMLVFLRRKWMKAALSLLLCGMCIAYFFGAILIRINSDYTPQKKITALRRNTEIALDAEAVRTDHGFRPGNQGGLKGYMGTGYYWSLLSEDVFRYYHDLEIPALLYSFRLEGTSGDTIQNAVDGTLYAVREANDAYQLPYGYEKVSESVYRNTMPLSLGYAFANRIPESYYDSLDAAAKKTALLKGAILADGVAASLPELRPEGDAKEIAYTITGADEIEISEGLIRGKPGNTFKIEFE